MLHMCVCVHIVMVTASFPCLVKGIPPPRMYMCSCCIRVHVFVAYVRVCLLHTCECVYDVQLSLSWVRSSNS